MNKLNKNSDALSRVNSKYYLDCLNIVIKVGIQKSIDKDYSIGKKLQSIPGFIQYIHKVDCDDDIKDKIAIYFDDQYDTIDHLLMSYLPLGSMRVFDWEHHIDAFRSCWKQLITSLYIAFKTYGFLHSDIHLGNVLISETKKTSIKYSDRDVACHGYEIVIMDFENSFVNVDTGDTTHFYLDMRRIVSDITYVLKLEFDEMETIERFIIERCHLSSKLDDIFQLFDIIDRMKFLGKRKPFILSYDPNVF